MNTANENVWQEFFDAHAPAYMENCFTRNTIEEVDFVIRELSLVAGNSILDIGCGTGRHSVELAGRGFRMTGVDISAGMLAEAQKTAEKAGVEVELVHSNAADYKANQCFDAAICLCEGAFSLLGDDDDPIERDLTILRNISASLKPGARLILTMPSAFRKIRQYSNEDVEKGNFDPLSMVEFDTMEWDGPDGKQSRRVRERGYVPTELKLLLMLAGFEVENIWGGTAGNWGHRPIDLDEIEMMVIARKMERTA